MGAPVPVSADTVSIRAPREGSDNGQGSEYHARQVSIRAPREGSDPCLPSSTWGWMGFNPRPP